MLSLFALPEHATHSILENSLPAAIIASYGRFYRRFRKTNNLSKDRCDY